MVAWTGSGDASDCGGGAVDVTLKKSLINHLPAGLGHLQLHGLRNDMLLNRTVGLCCTRT